MFSSFSRRAVLVAGVAGAFAAGATGVAVASSDSRPSAAPAHAAAQNVCSPEKIALRTALRTAIRAERKQEGHRLDGATRQKIAKPILDDAVHAGTIKQKAEDRILARLGHERPGRKAPANP